MDDDRRARIAAFRSHCGGAVVLPDDPRYEAARRGWNRSVDQRPALVAYPATAAEVSAVVTTAADLGLRVAVQGTGHNAGPLGDLGGSVLVRTSAMTGVQVHPDRRTMRVQAGALWSDVIASAAGLGWAVLHGSAADVSVVGYSLGGGVGWYGRTYGLQSNAVVGATVVLADGRVDTVSADCDSELLWALRGGGGNFGVVTDLEFAAFPHRVVYAGLLGWPLSYAHEVARRWLDWTRAVPDAVTTSLRILRLPRRAELPRHLSGRELVVVEGAVLAADEAADRMLSALRALRPELDTFGPHHVGDLATTDLRPTGPTRMSSESAVLSDVTTEAVDALIEAVATRGVSNVELRHLGGALGRVPDGSGALGALAGEYLLHVSSHSRRGDATAPGATRSALTAVAPLSSGMPYLSLVDRPVDTASAYRSADWVRLRTIRAALDPQELFHANHPIPPLPA